MQRLEISMLLAGMAALSGPALAAGSPFDPSAYLTGKEAAAAQGDTATEAKKSALKTHGIYRINGKRFHKFASDIGAVYLPGAGSLPDFTAAMDEFVICEEHLKLLNEVLPVRENLPVEPEIKPLEAKIVEQIRRCTEGHVKSPVLTVKNPDGATVEIRAPVADDKMKKALTKGDPHRTRDDAFDEREDATAIGVDINK